MSDNNIALLLRRDVVRKCDILPDEDLGKVVRAVFNYFDGIEPKFENRSLEYIFRELLEFPLRYATPDKRKYTSPENGKKGGRPRKMTSQPAPEEENDFLKFINENEDE